jgi:hypothetical protein
LTPRPFLDDIGIDLREETVTLRSAFDAFPVVADVEKIPHASQGGPGKPVHCGHVEVAEKHWLYPPDVEGHPGIPLEFAYGPLKVNPDTSGCDLRPADPTKADSKPLPVCCGTTGGAAVSHADEGAPSGYYRPSDLNRFGEIGRSNPALSDGFFDCYG